jgi:cytoskeletal protein RodZ
MAKGTFGERLKRERELREVSADEVANATRISPRFLQALENEDWAKLPGGVFGRGFVRTIARYLGLDEDSLLAEYDLARSGQLPSGSPTADDPIPSPPNWMPALFALLLLLGLACVVVGAIYGWRAYSAHRARKHSSSLVTSPQPAAHARSASFASDQPALIPPPLDLSVSASAPVHVIIRADGKPLFDGQFSADETRHFRARNSFKVSATNSSVVLLELNGQAMPPLGQPGASGTMELGRNDLRLAAGGNSQP